MRSKINSSSYIAFFVVTTLILLAGLVEYHWWLFAIPVFCFGVYAGYKNWMFSSFKVGFFSGFLAWFLSNMYYSFSFNGIILRRLGAFIFASNFTLMIIAGLLAGIIAFLSLHAGRKLLLLEEE